MRVLRSMVILAVLVILVLPSVQAAERFVIAEIFTAQNCQYCAEADPALGRVYERNRGRFAVVAFHPESYGGEIDPMGNTLTKERERYYDVGGYPTVVFDGVETVGGGYPDVDDDYQARIDERKGGDAPLTLSVGTTLDGTSVRVWTNGTPETDVVHDTVLTVVLIQDHVAFNGSNGLDDFRFVARKVRTKDVNVLVGEPFSKRFTFDIEGMPADDIRIVAFVQDMETYEVLQGAQRSVKAASAGTSDARGEGSEGLTTVQLGLITLIGVLGAIGAYMVIDDRRRKDRTAARKRVGRPPTRSRPVPRRRSGVPASGRERQRGRSGRSKRRKRHR